MVIIRKAMIDDTDKLAGILVDSWRHYFTYLSEAFFEKFKYEDKVEMFQRVINERKANIDIAIDCMNDKAAGYCSYAAKDGEVEIISFFVAPSYNRVGIGTKLLSECVDYGIKNNCHKVVLWTFQQNVIGRAFYEKNGFQLTAKTKINTFCDNNEEVLYEKVLE